MPDPREWPASWTSGPRRAILEWTLLGLGAAAVVAVVIGQQVVAEPQRVRVGRSGRKQPGGEGVQPAQGDRPAVRAHLQDHLPQRQRRVQHRLHRLREAGRRRPGELDDPAGVLGRRAAGADVGGGDLDGAVDDIGDGPTGVGSVSVAGLAAGLAGVEGGGLSFAGPAGLVEFSPQALHECLELGDASAKRGILGGELL